MKAKKLIVLALLAMLVVSTVACGGGGGEPAPTPTPAFTPTPTPTRTLTPGVTPTPTLPPTEEYLTYTDEANGFSISYPEGWKIRPEEESNSLFKDLKEEEN